MAHQLTQGVLMAIANNEMGTNDIKPVLQVTSIRSISSKEGSSDRFRLLLSDGVNSQPAMLATQLNQLVRDGALQSGSVIKLIQFVSSNIQGRSIIILSDIEIIQDSCDIIGETRQFNVGENADVRGGTGMTSHSMNQPIAGNLVRPSHGGSLVTNPAPRPHIGGSSYGGSQVTNMAPRPNVGGYGGSQVMNSGPRPNMSGNSYGGSAVPTYQKAEYGSGVSQAPANNYIHQSRSYINPMSHNQRPQSCQRPAMHANRGPAAKNETARGIMPISALHPYQGMWAIKARVTVKTELRTFTNTKGEGKVFSFDLLDFEGGEIRVTCFNEVAKKFYDDIKQGGVYTISKGMLKHANKKFNHLRHEYEITLDNSSTVESCAGEENSIPEVQWHFRCISDIEGLDSGTVLDLIGVVTSIDKPISITRKDSTPALKRTLQVKDRSGRSVEITMWGNFCNEEGSEIENLCDSGNTPVLALKSGRVNEFNGKSVGTIATSQLFINPDIPQTQPLKEWFDREGKIAPAVPLSRESNHYVPKVISQIKNEGLGTSEKPDCIAVTATLAFIKVDDFKFCYTACPLKYEGRQCNKKVTDTADGKYECSRCGVMDKCDYRYILQMKIQDHTGETWVTAFEGSGAEIMGISAEALYNLKRDDEDSFAEHVKKLTLTEFIFKLKVKEETFNDESRVKSNVVKAEKRNSQTGSKFRFDSIRELEEGDPASLPPHLPENTIGFGTGNRDTQSPAMNYSGFTNSVARDSGLYTSQVGSYGKNQSAGSTFVSTGSTSYTTCTSCGGTGHSTANCPSHMPAPKQSYGSGFGNNSSPGPRALNVRQAYGSGNAQPRFGNNASHQPSVGSVQGECFKCHQIGHFASDCPGNALPAYGGGNVGHGRYGMVPNQQTGF